MNIENSSVKKEKNPPHNKERWIFGYLEISQINIPKGRNAASRTNSARIFFFRFRSNVVQKIPIISSAKYSIAKSVKLQSGIDKAKIRFMLLYTVIVGCCHAKMIVPKARSTQAANLNTSWIIVQEYSNLMLRPPF